MPSLLDRARSLADDLLAPAAELVDRADRVPPSHLSALAAAGLFGLLGPEDAGGLDAEPGTARRVVAAIGGGCGATLFVWVQHHGVVRTLRASPNGDLARELLAPMCAGRIVAGTAFAHVRRTGRPAVRATRIEGGWRLDGSAPWATSWGIAHQFSVAAVSDDGELVWSMLPGDRPHGVVAEPLALPVFGATRTVALRFERCHVPDDRVIAVEDAGAWRAADERRAALAQPATMGVADRAIGQLRGLGSDAVAAADALDAELAELWQRDDAFVAAVAAGDEVTAEASAHRAATLDHARRATGALLAAGGGASMSLDHPAQRLAREAMFYVIQAQTGAGRAAMLQASGRLVGRSPG